MSEYAKSLKKGISLSFFNSAFDKNTFSAIKNAGIDCIEMSGKFENYVHKLGFLERAEECGQTVSDAGLELWSLHLPFGQCYDTSNLRDFERDYALAINTELINAASRAGAKVCVLHASSSLFGEEEYIKRLPRANDAIKRMAETAFRVGVTLAVENQPKSIPTRYPYLMEKLLHDSCAKLCFDANHSLYMSGLDYLDGCIQLGMELATVHLSDYDFIDERHRMPGDGINDWNAILAYFEKIGYSGPLMYEVSRKPADRKEGYTLEQISENMTKLVDGML